MSPVSTTPSSVMINRRADVFIAVLPQPDGSLHIGFDASNPAPPDQNRNERFTQASNRRTGR